MGVGAYLRVRTGMLVRSRITMGMLLLVLVACVVSSLIPAETGFGPSLYGRRRDALSQAMERDEVRAQDGEGASLLFSYEASLVALEQARPGLTGDWKPFVEDAAKAAELAVRMGESGLCPFGTGGVGPETSVRAELGLTRALGEGEWPIYACASRQPALFRLASVPSLLPGLAWCLPALVMACVLGRDRSGGRLLAQSPVSPRVALVVDAGLAWVSGLLVVALGWGAAALVALRNGVGSLAYPVALVSAEGARVISVGASVAWCFLALAMSTLVIALVSTAVAWGERRWVPSLVAGGLLACGSLLALAQGGEALGPLRFLDPLRMAPQACYPGDGAWAALVANPLEAIPLLSLAAVGFVAMVALCPLWCKVSR